MWDVDGIRAKTKGEVMEMQLRRLVMDLQMKVGVVTHLEECGK